MANDIIDIDVFQTVETVDITVQPNLTTVNITQVIGGGGGSQNLQSVTDIGSSTTNSLTANSFIKSGGAGLNILLDNGATVALSSIGGNTNLSTNQTASNFTINSDTGTDATIPLGNGILAGATLNDYTTAEKNKLGGIATSATANSSDATLLARANHTGTQLASTISDFNTSVQSIADAKVAQTITNGVTATAPSQDVVFDALALKQNVIALTTTGTSGASTFIGNTLNIPQYSGATDLGYTPSPTNGIVTSSTGTSATLLLADSTNAGLLTPAEKTKIADVDNKLAKNVGTFYTTNFIRTVTLAEYNAIGTKDATTLYFII